MLDTLNSQKGTVNMANNNDNSQNSTETGVQRSRMGAVNPVLNTQQLQRLFMRTPKNHILERQGRGGQTWKFVTGAYIKKSLNFIFGFNWDFEVTEEWEKHGQIIVKGRLTGRITDPDTGEVKHTLTKTDFGRADIKYKTDFVGGKKVPTDKPLDVGNDYKAAATDALKRCANQLGIASDVYNSNEFKEVKVLDDNVEDQETADAKAKKSDDMISKAKEQLKGVENAKASNTKSNRTR